LGLHHGNQRGLGGQALKNPREWVRILAKELLKHSQKDGCYNCKQILKAMGLNPEKSFEEQFKETT